MINLDLILTHFQLVTFVYDMLSHTDLVLEIDGPVSAGTNICVNQCALNTEKEEREEQRRREELMRAQEHDMAELERQRLELEESEGQM